MAKILIAEDEPDISQLIAFSLVYHGHEVLTAADGQEALDAAGATTPNLILMDVRMPRLDGLEACRLIKQVPGLQRVPVIFLTARGQDEEIQAGYAAGGSGYILKPFSVEELVRHVHDYLEGCSSG